MKLKTKKILIATVAVLLTFLIVISGLYVNEIRSLLSISRIDDYGMFQMRYYGDYGFDEFLKEGAQNDRELEQFITSRLLKGLPIDLGITDEAGCTVFIVRNEKGEVIMGRNFDFAEYAPSMQVITAPKNGYKSVSTANLSFAGYNSPDKLPSGLNVESFLALAAPYMPFDGMNEAGVAIALLAVPEYSYIMDSEKVTLNTSTAIRLVLDKAGTVEEAVDLLRQYNIYFSGDIYCHFLIADKSGKSVLVEYYDGELKTVRTSEDYQIASNFIAYNNLNIGEGFSEFERYDSVEERILSNSGKLTEAQIIDLLAEVGVYNENKNYLQWSVVYNLSTGDTQIFANRNTDNIVKCSLFA